MTTIAQFASAHNVSLVDVAAHLDTSHGLTPDTELTINDLSRLANLDVRGQHHLSHR